MTDNAATTTSPAGPGEGPRARRWPRRLLWPAIWLVIIVAALFADQRLEAAYHSTLGSVDALTLPAYALTELLKLRPVFLFAILLLLADRRLRWRFATDFTVVMLLQAVANSGLKELFGRMRPDSPELAGRFLGPMGAMEGNSVPSGHAVAAWALAAAMAAYYPRWRWAFYIGAVLVCLARVQLGAHYPGDVIAGGVIGWYIAQGLMQWLERQRTTADGG